MYILNKHANKSDTALLFAKSNLALIKSMSMPRLELLAILTSAEAAKFWKK
ncbi:hypothetical protein LOAG_13246 [Loa loa]|uniref:Uncharacterized protein n=1 Tax=Loa loa TaxID=7209 RepID=A0A1S0TL68_LOALO|nr:hypothetical protein LOAG_13246 [Loa loa]EFO15266.1 hypothetical protein LOAG_13246 [Loa loa]